MIKYVRWTSHSTTNTPSTLAELEGTSSEISMLHCIPQGNQNACPLSLIVVIIEQG